MIKRLIEACLKKIAAATSHFYKKWVAHCKDATHLRQDQSNKFCPIQQRSLGSGLRTAPPGADFSITAGFQSLGQSRFNICGTHTRLGELNGFLTSALALTVVSQAGTGRNQTPDNDVLFQAAQ